MLKTTLVDDMHEGDPDEAPVATAGTVPFSLLGADYTIDLRDESLQRLKDALAPFIARATVVKAAPAPRTVLRTEAGRRYTAKVRRWGNEHGMDLGTGGRIPDDAYAAYDAVHPGEREAVEAKAARKGTAGLARPAAPAKPPAAATKPAVPQPRTAPTAPEAPAGKAPATLRKAPAAAEAVAPANGHPAKDGVPAAVFSPPATAGPLNGNGHYTRPTVPVLRAWAKAKGKPWARQHGVNVPDRGRFLPERLFELHESEYKAEHAHA